MKTLKIDKGIPIPESRNRSGFILLASKMKVGDSILLPRKLFNTSYYQRKFKMKFCQRKDKKDQYRIWRIV